MSHGIGAIQFVQDLLGPLVPLFGLVTQLGDVWFLLLVLSTLYLTDGWGLGDLLDRRATAYVIALAIGALGLTLGLKLLVGLPRPPGAGTPVGGRWLPGPLFDLYARATHAEGFGFPSGHAVGSTVVYGGLALVAGDSLSRRRLLAAGTLAGLVGFSRIAIGVHHLSSVLGGFAIGIAFLAVLTVLTDNGRRIGPAFLAAVPIGVFALLVSGFGHDATIVFGLAVGGAITWQFLGDRIETVALSERATALVVLGGFVSVGGLFVVIELVANLLVTLLLTQLLVTVLLVLPLVAAKRKREVAP